MADNKKQALYPIKFKPVSHDRVWGGHKLAKNYNKPFDADSVIGESWEIAGFENDSSIVENGFLAGNSLFDVMETYMDEITGDDHYKKYGNEFPLLIKLLDIQDRLSVQVHPDDETAFDRHNSYGKSEAWYVMEADPDAVVYMGFNRDITPDEFLERCKNETLEEVLNVYHPKKGDFFFVEAGIIHSGGGGLVIAEVQQLSDVTYRIYDWGREHNPATARTMHLEQAYDCINYKKYDESKYFVPAGSTTKLADNKFFTVNLIDLKNALDVHTESYESFIIYYCASGKATITPSGSSEKYGIVKGEWILVPAAMPDFKLEASAPETRVLEFFIRKPEEHDSYIDEN